MLLLWSHTLLAGAGGAPEYVLRSKQVQIAEVPKAMPPATFMDASGGQVNTAQFVGNVVMLNFWATWCAPCVEEMPVFDALQAEYGPRGLRIVAVSQDQGKASTEVVSEINRFYASYGIRHLPIFIDQLGNAYSAVNAVGLPTTVVIDKSGRERMRVAGVIDWQDAQFRGWLEQLLAE